MKEQVYNYVKLNTVVIKESVEIEIVNQGEKLSILLSKNDKMGSIEIWRSTLDYMIVNQDSGKMLYTLTKDYTDDSNVYSDIDSFIVSLVE